MAMVGNSVQLGQLLGDKPNGETPHDHIYGLTIAVSCSFLVTLHSLSLPSPLSPSLSLFYISFSLEHTKVGFLWLINISVNAMQGPARALISDMLPPDQQQLGNAIVTLTSGKYYK